MNDLKQKIADLHTTLQSRKPLIHNITNYVTVNDCANIQLAIGASPVMADYLPDALDITSISSALVINMGTLNAGTVESMIACGKQANTVDIPVIFDPVGAGASRYRNDAARRILDEVQIAAIRGNLSEISFIAGWSSSTKGVDVSESDAGNDSTVIAQTVSQKYDCTVGITGAVDVIAYHERIVYIHNGDPLMSRITGTGCMASALIGAYAGVTKDYFLAACAGICTMGIAGDIAYERAGATGTGSFHSAIIDAVSTLGDTIILERAKCNEA